MKLINKRIILGTSVLAVFLTISTLTLYASQVSKANFANLTTAIAQKYLSTDTVKTEIRCSTYSFTDNPPATITHLGYNSFSCQSLRSDNIQGSNVYWTAPSGAVNWNSSFQYEVHHLAAPSRPGFSRNATTAGVHDFGHYNGTTYDWDPALSQNTVFAP